MASTACLQTASKSGAWQIEQVDFKGDRMGLYAQPTTVAPMFCVPITRAYQQAYQYDILYWLGSAAVAKYGDHVVQRTLLNSVF